LSGVSLGGGFSSLGVTALASGLTEYGFEIPAGDAGSVSEAADAMRALGHAMSKQSHELSRAERSVRGDECWEGEAASAYGVYSGRLTAIGSANGAALRSAASALEDFAHELGHAQRVTRSALADCVRLQQHMIVQRGLADAAAKESLAATNKAIAAPHPALATTYQHEAGEALKRQGAAHAAADAAENELETAKRRGRHASDAYKLAETAISRQLQAATDGLHPAPKLSGAQPVPVSVTEADVQLANALLRAVRELGPDGVAHQLDGTELAAILGRPVTAGEVQAYNHARREALDDMTRPWGDRADRFGGIIHGLIGVRTFGNPETGGYRTGDRLGGMATDVTLGTTCVIVSVGACAWGATRLFGARSVGVVQDNVGNPKGAAKDELFNAVKTGLSAAPGGALGVAPRAAKAIQTSGSLATRKAAGKEAGEKLEQYLGKSMVKIGEHNYHIDIPVKMKLEILGGGVSQTLEQAKISAEQK
jgi:hypothetical protein